MPACQALRCGHGVSDWPLRRDGVTAGHDLARSAFTPALKTHAP